MTSFQSRLHDESRVTRILGYVATAVLLLALLTATIANYGLRSRLEKERVGLLTCNEFLADLEASEIIEE
jgi:hypothetical protein